MTGGAKGSLTDLNNITTSPIYAALNSFFPTNDPNQSTKPKAYLNWILLDEQLKYVGTYPQSGGVPVGNAAALTTLGYTGIPITKNGYLYIWVSNETPNWDAFFDNLSVKHYTGPILEETHYYPFGLTMAGISSKALKTNYAENKYKFGKQLLDDDLGLNWYQYRYRNYDPQIGRFVEIDPLASKYPYNATYAFAENKLGRGVELEGLELLGLTDFFFESNNVIPKSTVVEAVKTGVETTSKTEGHHVVPRGVENHPLVEGAKKGGFDFNGDENKMPLDKFSKESGEGVHGNHPNYNTEALRKLNEFQKENSDPSPEQAAEFLRNVVKDLQATIKENPGVKINDLFKVSTTMPTIKDGVIQGVPDVIKANTLHPSVSTQMKPNTPKNGKTYNKEDML